MHIIYFYLVPWLYFHMVFYSVFSHASLREQVSTLTWQLLWTTTIFNSKIARKSSQKRSPKLITFWLLSWTLLFVDLASQTLPFLSLKNPWNGHHNPSGAHKALPRGSKTLLWCPKGVPKTLLDRFWTTWDRFWLNFGSISTRFKTSPYAPS